jgi:serine/threonine-protein kinase PknG
MTAIACTQPGCTGTIEDGYCTTCGLAPAPPLAPASSPSSPSGGASGSSATGSGGTGSGGTAGSGSGGWHGGSGRSVTAGGYSSTASGPSGSRRGSRSTSGRSRLSRGGLGAGLVDVPRVPYRDPSTAVLPNPEVPEARRYCGHCDQPVGRSRGDGRPGLVEGFCRNCGTRFSFRPKLKQGDLIAGQYEVLGCLAHGGLGWIYLAQDHNVSDRWVVLKGLLNSGDADAMAAALAERQFLAEVEHPNIVRIINFVTHADADGETSGYIVMEYVGGKSLKQILQDARAGGGSVELKHALAYAIEVLPALGYLHDRGMVYCDFKPDNVIQTEEQLKLIDMGGVRRADSDDPIYGTVGYQAPEIADAGPSVESDLYTVGRALAVLTFEFRGYQREYKYQLPDGVPLLEQQESFRRLLLRATHRDPALRFQSAGEMVDQLTGVLREVVAVERDEPVPAYSRVFSPELRAVGTGAADPTAPPEAADVVAALPVPQVDGADPAAGYLATLAALEPKERAASLLAAVTGDAGVPKDVAESSETWLALARARIDAGDADGAAEALRELAAKAPGDWRVAWHDGLRWLASGQPQQAAPAFDAVYDELPGELAPKLALAIAAEAAGDLARAERYYRLVWTTDLSYVTAAFGLARTGMARNDRRAAVAALARVPATSSYHVAAQMAAIRVLVSRPADPAAPGGPAEDDLRQAAALLARLPLDARATRELTVEVLTAALEWATGGRNGAAGGQRQAPVPQPRQAGTPLLGCELTERSLRFGLERNYRELARLTSQPAERISLVDKANDARPRTWT